MVPIQPRYSHSLSLKEIQVPQAQQEAQGHPDRQDPPALMEQTVLMVLLDLPVQQVIQVLPDLPGHRDQPDQQGRQEPQEMMDQPDPRDPMVQRDLRDHRDLPDQQQVRQATEVRQVRATISRQIPIPDFTEVGQTRLEQLQVGQNSSQSRPHRRSSLRRSALPTEKQQVRL